nr:GntR family transcriptional regulator [Corynebacterium mucifaciens]
MGVNSDAEPLFVQVASFVADLIVDGTLKPGEQAPSTNQLAQFHEINPATARKGLALLVDDHVLEKRRGLGMFVTDGARDRILEKRREDFAGDYIAPLIDEALHLGYTRSDLHDLIDRVAESRGMYQ